MTESQFVQATFLFTVFVFFALFAWMPVTRGPRAFFGVRVDADYYGGAGRRALGRYRLVLAGVALAVVAAAAVARSFVSLPIVFVVAELTLTIALGIVYVRYASVVRPHASTDGATRFASSIRTRTAKKRAGLDAAVAALVALTFAAPLLSYNEMASVIPIHWDATGTPDGWIERSLFAILFGPALSAYMQIFLHVLRRDFAEAKMTLPADSTEEYLLAKEKLLQINVDTLDWVRVTIAALFCSISLQQTFTAVERLRALEPLARISLFAGAAALIAGIAFCIIRMIGINARLQQQTGNDYAQRATDESHWRHGGLTYSNPDDPALIVEKLVGVGYTLNMAHPGVRSRLWLMAGIPVFVIWAVVVAT